MRLEEGRTAACLFSASLGRGKQQQEQLRCSGRAVAPAFFRLPWEGVGRPSSAAADTDLDDVENKYPL